MAVNDIFRITIRFTNGVAGSSPSYVVPHYVNVSGSGGLDAEDAANEVIDNLLHADFLAALTANWTINQVEAVNLMDAEDFFLTNPDLVGTRSGTAVPAFVAWQIRSPLVKREVRRSRHRFPGAATSDLVGSGFWTSQYQGIIGALATDWGLQLENSEGLLDPCVVRIVDDLPVVAANYRGQWEYMTLPTTQVSRKIGYNWAAGL